MPQKPSTDPTDDARPVRQERGWKREGPAGMPGPSFLYRVAGLLRLIGFDPFDSEQAGLRLRVRSPRALEAVDVEGRVDLLDGHRLPVDLPPYPVARLILPAAVRLTHASPNGAGDRHAGDMLRGAAPTVSPRLGAVWG